MTKVSKGNSYLPKHSLDELIGLYQKEKNAKAKIRLLCAIHRKKGMSLQKISNVVILPVSTISDHLIRLQNDFNRLSDDGNQSRPTKLSSDDIQQLLDAISRSPTESNYPAILWTTKMIRHYIVQTFNVEYTLHGIRKLLHRNNFVRLKPRPEHIKGNKEQQKNFKKNYPIYLIDICNLDTKSCFWTNPALS